MSIIDGWKHEVANIVRNRIPGWNCDHKHTRTSFSNWSQIFSKNERGIIDFFVEVIVKLDEWVGRRVRSYNSGFMISKDSQLGKLRRKFDHSRSRKNAITAGMNRELTLERAIVKAMSSFEGEGWYNQFNVASGVAGPKQDAKTSVDLVRHIKTSDVFTFIELKDWKATDSPLRVFYEVILYGMMFSHVKQLLLASRQHHYRGDMVRMEKINLAAMIPDSWAISFRTKKYPLSPSQVFHFASIALNEAQKADPNLLPGIQITSKIYLLSGYSHNQLADLINHNDKIRNWVLETINQI